MEPDTGSHQLTTEQGTWRARCPETGTPGSGGGLGKRASGNTGTAPEAYLTSYCSASYESGGKRHDRPNLSAWPIGVS